MIIVLIKICLTIRNPRKIFNYQSEHTSAQQIVISKKEKEKLL